MLGITGIIDAFKKLRLYWEDKCMKDSNTYSWALIGDWKVL